MSILGVGVDVLHVPRVAALLKRRGPRLAARILSPVEALYTPIHDLPRQIRFLAVRWAVKEAAYKAMYPAVHPTWKELAYRGLNEGGAHPKPTLDYHPLALSDKLKIGAIHLSVSHDGEYIFASVTIEKPL